MKKTPIWLLLFAHFVNKKIDVTYLLFWICFSFEYTFHVIFMFLYFSLLVETKPRLTKETAFVLGMFNFLRFFVWFICSLLILLFFFSLISKANKKNRLWVVRLMFTVCKNSVMNLILMQLYPLFLTIRLIFHVIWMTRTQILTKLTKLVSCPTLTLLMYIFIW